MKTQLVPVDAIQVHWPLNRARDCDHVRALATHINRDGFNENYPIRVVKFENGDLHLGAGHHRFAAAIGEHIRDAAGDFQRDLTFENLPLSSVPAEIFLGDMDDVIRLMQLDNFKHDAAVNAGVGKALSRDEKKEQCLRLLAFPEFFGKSLRVLETEFGMPRSTIAELKKELTVRLGQCAERELSDLELLNKFGLTRARFDKMRLLIRSGERAGADGRVTKTQASAVKKEDARELAVSEFRSAHDVVQKAIDTICEKCDTLTRETIKRRLYSQFDLGHETNASRWSVEKLASQLKSISALQTELSDLKTSLWAAEFWNAHRVARDAAALRALGAPFLTKQVEQVLENADFCKTADFEVIDEVERRKDLENLAIELSGVLQDERKLRSEKKAREDAAAREEKARADLEKAVRAATRACDDLKETFGISAISDTSPEGYEEFLRAACAGGKYSSRHLSVRHFLYPEEISESELGYRISGIAKKIRLHIAASPPLKWIKPFLKVQNPLSLEDSVSGLPSSVEKPSASEPRATELPKSVYDPGAVNLPPRPAPGNSLSEKRASASADTRVPAQKSDNQNAEEQVGARASVRSEMSDLETDSAVLESDLQTAADAVTAILPAGERGRGDVISHISEKVFKEKSLSTAERLAILRDLILRDLRVLQTERLTSKKK